MSRRSETVVTGMDKVGQALRSASNIWACWFFFLSVSLSFSLSKIWVLISF